MPERSAERQAFQTLGVIAPGQLKTDLAAVRRLF
jgi:hypothetical protein